MSEHTPDHSGTLFEKLHAKWRKGRQELANLNRAHEAVIAERDSLRAVNAELLEALKEARRWIGDGDMGDGMAREIWTPKYTAAVDMVDAAIASARKQENQHG